MKFTVEQSVLTDGVNWVSRSLSSRPIKTELLGIFINATNNEVLIGRVERDLETQLTPSVNTDCSTVNFISILGSLMVWKGYSRN